MAKLSTFALAGALAVAALAPVAGFAADLPEPPLLEPAPEPVEFGSGWYLRGDIGYKSYRDPKINYTGYTNGGNFGGEKMKDAVIIGGGVGYKFNNWFRSDVTLDYETPAKWRGSLDSPNPACPAASNCGSHDSGRISALTVFWNGYLDLGTWAGVTPYIGGGIGAARLDVTKYKSTAYAGCPIAICGAGTTSYKGDDKWNFAWNLQAGAAYAFTQNLLIDANYRYVDLGEARSGTIPPNGGKVKFKDITAHEVRVGVRYLID